MSDRSLEERIRLRLLVEGNPTEVRYPREDPWLPMSYETYRAPETGEEEQRLVLSYMGIPDDEAQEEEALIDVTTAARIAALEAEDSRDARTGRIPA